jgi:hypothetical protein
MIGQAATTRHVGQGQIAVEPAAFVRPDGSLDMGKLLADWQAFWREGGHVAAKGFTYREAGPHLMLMAFLQRTINGGARSCGSTGSAAVRWTSWWNGRDSGTRSR